MKKNRINKEKQEKLIEYFVLGVTARSANVNRNTAIYYFHRLRKLIFDYQEKENTMFSVEIEIDENYFGDHKKWKNRIRSNFI